MKIRKIGLSALVLTLSTLLLSAQNRAEELLADLKDPNSKTVFVVAHRGDWRNACENSVDAILNCIEMGVDIVEIDLKMTKDGELVLMHDKTLNRTTNGKGPVSEKTLEEIKQLVLRDGSGVKTHHKVPTLREAMLLTKGKILVNLDQAWLYMDKVQEILKETGTENQAIYKGGDTYEKVRERYGKLLDEIIYMPIVFDTKEGWKENIAGFMANYKPIAFEVLYATNDSPMLEEIKKMKEAGVKVWVNVLWPYMAAGHSDEFAVKDPEGNWGWVIKNGANILQTDRPQKLLDYLRSKGLHK